MRRARLNLIEVAMVCVLVGVVAYVVARYRTESRLQPFLSTTASELVPLAERYGNERQSEHGEEWIIRDFFDDERDGVFVDVGANHYRRQSNTYYLETTLGWRGLAIEPQTKFAADYATHRPKTTFVPMFVSDASKGTVALFVPHDNDLIASADQAFVQAHGGGEVDTQQARAATLDEILDTARIDRIDFLSIDIELHEPEALRGFAIGRFKPRLVAIEAHPQVRQQILDYFAAHRYVIVAKYLRADSENLWFMPASS